MTFTEIDITVGNIHLVRWLDGQTYESDVGATYYSGATEPDSEDAADCIQNPRTPPESSLSIAETEHLLDAILDGWAQAWGYADAARCVTYVGDPEPQFDAEGVAMRNARSALWTAVRQAGSSPSPASYTESAIRAFAAQFQPTRPAL